MGLSDFIMLIDRLGIVGVIITIIFVGVMFIGSVVDIQQFWWRVRRHRQKRERAYRERVKAELLMEMHKERDRKPG